MVCSLLLFTVVCIWDFLFPLYCRQGFAFRLIVEIITAGWLVLAVQSPKYRPQRSFILLKFVIFIIVLGLATLLGENPYRSFGAILNGWRVDRPPSSVLLFCGGYFGVKN